MPVRLPGKAAAPSPRRMVRLFTTGEEEAIHLTKFVPFLVEDELTRIGGLYEKAKDWESHAVISLPTESSIS
jgi:hypothetical protein